MSAKTLEAIVGLCLKLDRQAIRMYRSLAEVTKRKDLAGFWTRMAADKKEHVVYWKKLLELVKAGHVPQIFKDPEKTLHELTIRYDRIQEIIERSEISTDATRQFILALQIEFILLHPSLEKLWYFLGIARPGLNTPEDLYEKHLKQFTSSMRTYCPASPELELLGDSVMQMWGQLKELTREVEVDMLTRTRNRRGLFSDMKMLAHLARRNDFTSGALLIDIDNFKGINDLHGHQVGDAVLADIAKIIAAQVRKSDVVGRYGGEEFLVFLPQTESTKLTHLAEKIRSSVERRMKPNYPATISIGAACTNFTDKIDDDLDRLIREADTCLYQAKAAGRNRVITPSVSL